MRIRIVMFLLLLGLLAMLAGCGADRSTRPGYGAVRVSMTDAPARYDEVNIVLREVHIHRVGDGEAEWIVVRSDSEATYNLLELRNGVFVPIGFADDIPAGAYDQIRLVLGEGSNVVEDGVTHLLETPSAIESGIKLKGSFEVVAGGLVEVVLDFDAARSVRVAGNGKHLLHPVIRFEQLELTGAIHGVLDPATDAEVHAVIGANSITTIPGPEGEFTLAALPEGTYSVAIDVAAGFRDTTITDVQVTRGQTTDLGTIPLSPEAP